MRSGSAATLACAAPTAVPTRRDLAKPGAPFRQRRRSCRLDVEAEHHPALVVFRDLAVRIRIPGLGASRRTSRRPGRRAGRQRYAGARQAAFDSGAVVAAPRRRVSAKATWHATRARPPSKTDSIAGSGDVEGVSDALLVALVVGVALER